MVPLTSVILLDAFRSFVGKFWFLIRYIFKGFSQCRVVVGYALQVFPVVTRLTVYRRLQVMTKYTDRGILEKMLGLVNVKAMSGRAACAPANMG